MKTQTPKIGEVVQYVASDFGGPNKGRLTLPGIVTAVNLDGTLNLQVVPDGTNSRNLPGSNLGNPNGLQWVKGAKRDSKFHREGTWDFIKWD